MADGCIELLLTSYESRQSNAIMTTTIIILTRQSHARTTANTDERGDVENVDGREMRTAQLQLRQQIRHFGIPTVRTCNKNSGTPASHGEKSAHRAVVTMGEPLVVGVVVFDVVSTLWSLMVVTDVALQR